jgi:uncharacterized coiled-coil protein SlyX
MPSDDLDKRVAELENAVAQLREHVETLTQAMGKVVDDLSDLEIEEVEEPQEVESTAEEE